jgi:asparagine synthase (glutamine-hydrolysing)
MSVLAGIVSRRSEAQLEPARREALKQSISRHPGDTLTSFQSDRVCLLKADSGAYKYPAFRNDPSGSVAMLAGEPLLASSGTGADANRSRDLEKLHAAWDADAWDILKEVQGVFAAAYFRPQGATLYLIADKLSLRPIYYWSDDSFVVFATALRILEALPFVPKVMDLRAVTEIACFGFPLGVRTPYRDIRAIRAAEVIRFGEASVSSTRYWYWDSIPVSRDPEPELLRHVSNCFHIAVGRRLHGDKVVSTFLSGGLDSRCIVAALCAQAEKVHTLNFSFPNTQEREFSEEFARRMGTFHRVENMMVGDTQFFERMKLAWEAHEFKKKWPPERPRLIWSGDGGSVGLGHAYITSEAVELLRRGERALAYREFLQKRRVIRGLLRPDLYAALADVPARGMQEEFDEIHCEDPGTALHVFLLLNDQRRHLAGQFEGTDLHRVEFLMPFFDSDFLAAVMAVPLDLRILHRFYNKWLFLFPEPVHSVPWQAYPGHEPCPLPMRQGLGDQWDLKNVGDEQARRKRALLHRAQSLVQDKGFPSPLLQRSRLLLAWLAYRTNLRDYGYVLETALLYKRYWEICDGRFAIA